MCKDQAVYTGLHAYFNEFLEALAVAFILSRYLLVLQTTDITNKSKTKNVLHKTKQHKH